MTMRPALLTLSAAVIAVESLRNLHRICMEMDAELAGERPTEVEYQVAMRAAARALAQCPDTTGKARKGLFAAPKV